MADPISREADRLCDAAELWKNNPKEKEDFKRYFFKAFSEPYEAECEVALKEILKRPENAEILKNSKYNAAGIENPKTDDEKKAKEAAKKKIYEDFPKISDEVRDVATPRADNTLTNYTVTVAKQSIVDGRVMYDPANTKSIPADGYCSAVAIMAAYENIDKLPPTNNPKVLAARQELRRYVNDVIYEQPDVPNPNDKNYAAVIATRDKSLATFNRAINGEEAMRLFSTEQAYNKKALEVSKTLINDITKDEALVKGEPEKIKEYEDHYNCYYPTPVKDLDGNTIGSELVSGATELAKLAVKRDDYHEIIIHTIFREMVAQGIVPTNKKSSALDNVLPDTEQAVAPEANAKLQEVLKNAKPLDEVMLADNRGNPSNLPRLTTDTGKAQGQSA